MKIGRLICGWNVQAPEPALNSPDRSRLEVPALAVRLTLGKRRARRADIGVGRLQLVLGLENVRASLQQIRRQPGRQLPDQIAGQWLRRQLLGTGAPTNSVRLLRSCATWRL